MLSELSVVWNHRPLPLLRVVDAAQMALHGLQQGLRQVPNTRGKTSVRGEVWRRCVSE